MEFDKSKVYTSVNADELKEGSKVICAFSIAQLKERVEEGEQITEVRQILSEDVEQRIKVYYKESYMSYPLAYLISEPEEKKLKWTDLKLGDIIRYENCSYIITGVDINKNSQCHVQFNGNWYSDKGLEEWEKVE